jgi:hypothetical protein
MLHYVKSITFLKITINLQVIGNYFVNKLTQQFLPEQL